MDRIRTPLTLIENAVLPTPVRTTPVSWTERVGGLVEMTKYRLSSLVVVTAGAGYLLAEPEAAIDPLRLGVAMIGTTLAAFGANVFNQVLEADLDRQMARTCGRAIPSGRVTSTEGFLWGVLLLVVGAGLLALLVNPLTASLALLVAVLYAAVYTPLKQRTSLNTLVGAVCGALPPVIGWVAVRGEFALGAWVLFAILFAWQIPHFLAIDWFHRDDYERGGYQMASRVDASGRFSARLGVIYALALIPITFCVIPAGIGGWLTVLGGSVLGLAFLALTVAWYLQPSRQAARRVFFASLAYLPLLLGLLVLDPTR
ncbi:MAG: protoheme IX farnesyltransferase [Planctomycetes bacterium]|nr:protoheme IX farnesyltransferase [Planctomycetota bacterium]